MYLDKDLTVWKYEQKSIHFWEKKEKDLRIRTKAVLTILKDLLWNQISSLTFVANNVTLLNELIGQGSTGHAIGQADSEVWEPPFAGSQSKLLQNGMLQDCNFLLLPGHTFWYDLFLPRLNKYLNFK